MRRGHPPALPPDAAAARASDRLAGRRGLDLGQLVAAASLAIGEEASPERLARSGGPPRASTAARAISTLGSRSSRARLGEAGQDVTVVLSAGIPARLAQVRLEGPLGLPEKTATEALGLRTGDRYRRPRCANGSALLEERLRREGFFEARVTGRPPAKPGRGHPGGRPHRGRRCRPAIRGDLRRTALLASPMLLGPSDPGSTARWTSSRGRGELGGYWRLSTASEGTPSPASRELLDRAVDPPAIGFLVTEGPKCESRR